MEAGGGAVKGSPFEPWMLANLALGMGQMAFLPLLMVPFVVDVSGDPQAGGVIAALVGLSALLGPVIGGLADRYRAHRLVVTIALFGLAAGYALYSLAALDNTARAFDAIVVGVSIATVAAIAPSFILDVGLPEKLRTRRLTVFYMLTTTGQIIAGILLGILADWSYERRFFLAAGLIGALAVFFWFVSAEPAKRIQVRKAAPEGEPERTEPRSMRKILISIFGVLLLMAVFAGIGYNAIISQITQIMDETFGITHGTTSFLIAAVGVVNLGGFLVAGKLLGRKGGLASAMSAQALHLTGIVGMLVVSIASPTTAIMAGFFMIVFYLGEPFGRIPQPVVATQFSGMPTSTATGWYLAALAGSATLSGLLAGAIAQEFGYDAILWLATGAFAIAITIGLIFLRPVDLRMRARPMPAGTPADAPR